MTYRVCRKRSTTTFKLGDQYCKVFLTPRYPYVNDRWLWKFGFAVSKSKRQLNDWYKGKKNKRAEKLRENLTGRQGIKTITQGFHHVLLMRWLIEPGDALFIDCTSIQKFKQFRAFYRWTKQHPDWVVLPSERLFMWYRPPYWNDPIYECGKITAAVPADPTAPVVESAYYECFLLDPDPEVLQDMLRSRVEIENQSDLVQ